MPTLKDLQISTIKDIQKLNIGETTINIKQYLPISKKRDLVEITLDKAVVGGFINPALEEVYFSIYMIMMYTDIEFTQEEIEDIEGTYDKFESNGLIELIMSSIPVAEYDCCYEYYHQYANNFTKSQTNAAGVVKQILEELPQSAMKASEMIQGFDMNQFENVVNFAAAANAGRPINNLQTTETLSQE